MMQVLTGEQFIQKALNRLSQTTAHKLENKDINNISYNENVNDYYDKIIIVESTSNEDIYISDEILGLFIDLLLYRIEPDDTGIMGYDFSYEIGDLTISTNTNKTKEAKHETELRLPIKFHI